jgi:hypothetical protein
MKKLAMVLIVLALSWGTVEAFTYVTPLGITIKATTATINQYNTHWANWEGPVFPKRPGAHPSWSPYRIGPKWATIDWDQVDRMYLELSDKYGVTGSPSTLVIKIYPLNYACHDESSYPYSYEFSYPDYGCIDGIYPDTNTIIIHLGDDPGQLWKYSLNASFCATALDWELFHYFLYWKGDGCWWDEFNLVCQAKYRAPSNTCLFPLPEEIE